MLIRTKYVPPTPAAGSISGAMLASNINISTTGYVKADTGVSARGTVPSGGSVEGIVYVNNNGDNGFTGAVAGRSSSGGIVI